jgi:sugar phosphate isomerase/epimerase
MHLLSGFDPKYLGAYLDPGHMVVEGEEFGVGAAMVKKYLSIIALKDVLLVREEKNNHGKKVCQWVTAGKGMVDWTAVFSELVRIGFAGPLSIHCEFEVLEQDFITAIKEEISFFRSKLTEVL